jgi:hypothetical protein
VEHVGNGGQRLHLDPSRHQLGPDLAQRDALLLRHHLAKSIGVRLEQGTAVAADLGWGSAAGPAQPLHQLDGGRGTDREALGRLPDRAAFRYRTSDPLAQVARQGCRHGEFLCCHLRYPESDHSIPCNSEPL